MVEKPGVGEMGINRKYEPRKCQVDQTKLTNACCNLKVILLYFSFVNILYFIYLLVLTNVLVSPNDNIYINQFNIPYGFNTFI